MSKELNKDGMFYTRDLACAAYLKTKGFPMEVERLGRRGVFYYKTELQPEVDKFFKGEGDYLDFAGNMRGLKSQIQNTRIKEEENAG
jgi:hypothetical protein